MSDEDDERLRRELLLRSILPSLPVGAYAPLSDELEEEQFEPNARIFGLGEPADTIYFLVEGKVVMEGEGKRPWHFEAFAVVGVIDALLERKRARGCRALSRAAVLSLKASAWFDLLEDNAEIARATVRNFARQLHHRSHEKSADLRGPLPPAEPRSLEPSTYGKIVTLQRAEFLRRAGLQAVASLATLAEARRLGASELLFDYGEAAEHLYVVASGSIEVADGDGFRHRYGPGQLVGGPAALCDCLSGYTARALSDALVLRIAEQDYYDLAEEHPRLTRGTLAYLVSELEQLLGNDGAAPQAEARAAEV